VTPVLQYRTFGADVPGGKPLSLTPFTLWLPAIHCVEKAPILTGWLPIGAQGFSVNHHAAYFECALSAGNETAKSIVCPGPGVAAGLGRGFGTEVGVVVK
jgi:hypothetical protein